MIKIRFSFNFKNTKSEKKINQIFFAFSIIIYKNAQS